MSDALKPTKIPFVSTLVRQSKVLIYPYNKASRSAGRLAEYFHRKVTDTIMLGKMNVPPDVTIVYWGIPEFDPWEGHPNPKWNKPSIARLASNKLRTFQKFQEWNSANPDAPIQFPEITTDQKVAKEWVADGHEVFGRRAVSHSGKDIVIISDDLESFVMGAVSRSEFYSRYIKKQDEYRVHVFKGTVIDVQRKALSKTDASGNPVDPAQVDFRIRNLANGFVFVRNELNVPEQVFEQARRAVDAVDLDFGAVDVIWNTQRGAFVLEINTAPGLEGSTIQSYTQAIENSK